MRRRTAKDDPFLAKILAIAPLKKKVTFSISEVSKQMLAEWCGRRNLTESAAIEAMIWFLTMDPGDKRREISEIVYDDGGGMPRFPKGSTPKLTLELIESIALPIRNGAYVETAVALAGVSRDSFYRWLKQGREEGGNRLTRLLSDTIKKAMAEAEMRDLAVIDRAAQSGEWTAAAWRLERKHPERWGRQAKVQLEHSGSEDKPIKVQNYDHLSDAEVNERILKIHKRLSIFIANKKSDPD